MNRLLILFPLLAAACDSGGIDTLPAVQGWAYRGGLQRFTPDNLYRIIDGEAEVFLRYGFNQALFQDYVNEVSGAVVNAELYQMGSPLDAFGIYSVSRTTKGKAVDLGGGGTLGSTQLTFYQGIYFGRITVSELEGAGESLMAIGRAVSGRLPAHSTDIPELQYIDLPEIDGNTVQFIAKDALDIPGLNRCLVADVRIDDGTAKAFVAISAGPGKKTDAWAAIQAYAREKGAAVESVVSPYQVKLPKLDWMIVAVKGPMAAGVACLSDPESGAQLIEKLLVKLPD